MHQAAGELDTEMKTEIIVNVKGCARCHDNHPALRFTPLINADDEYTWWAKCPNVGQPILLAVTQSDDPEIPVTTNIEIETK